MTAREAAARILAAVRREGSYSNVLLESSLRNTDLSAQDQALVTRLVYGVIERQLTLDYHLSACCSRPLKKLHPLVVDHLRLAAYQILFAERIPDSAAVNEAVNAVKKQQPHAAGFVNGVLRGLIRKKKEGLALPNGEEGLSVKYSCPLPLIRLWREGYGEQLTEKILSALSEEPPMFLRVNTLKTDVDTFLQKLREADVSFRVVEELPACVEVFEGAALKKLAKSVQNCYYHQDMASQFAVAALGARADERVADVCAAPGGKSLTAAQYMENRGEILSSDIYPAKCDELARRAENCGADIIRVVCRDASKEPPRTLHGTFDRVICDAPCSGLGVIRRRPEIRYKDLSHFAELSALQFKILCEAAKLVRVGGVLQYSTCTLNPQENEAVAKAFLQSHPQFSPRPLLGLPSSECGEPDWYRTLFPAAHGPDGFFVAGFIRKN